MSAEGLAIVAPAEDAPAVHARRPLRVRAAAAVVVIAAAALAIGIDGLDRSVPGPVRVALVVAGAVGVSLAGGRLLDRWAKGRAGLWAAVAWLAIVVLAAACADVLPLSEGRDVSKTLTVPSLLRPDLLSAHPLGTDRQGLDVLAALLYGARVSLTVGIMGVASASIVGGTIGLLAGYYRGAVDRVVGIISDSMLAFPPLVLLLAMVTMLQPSVRNVTIGLAVLATPSYIRLVRANTLTFAQREFVTSARGLGASDRRIIFREILPNVALPVLSYSFVVVAVVIVAEASLSFLGLGVQRPNPTWGNLIAAGQESFDTYPHLVFGPGACLLLTIFALNRVGDRLRAVWE